MALTETSIRALKPSGKAQKVYDTGGLYLSITPSGAKSWRFKYRMFGKEKKLALGNYPLITLKEARLKRDEAKKQLLSGIDPSAQRQADKRMAALSASNSFKAIAEEWHKTNKAKWTERHASVLLRRLELHIFPHIGHRPVKEIKPMEVLDAIRRIEKRKATHLSHRLLQVCKLIFRYAIVTERAEYNAAADLQGALVAHKEKHYPTLKAKELPQFIEALDAVKTTVQNKLAVRLLLHTFMRQGELRHSKWADINWDHKEWYIPAENTKMRDSHLVPLSSQALTLLNELRALTGWSSYLFPSQQRQKNPVISENTINVVIKRMGYEGKIVGHGFRALASTILNEHGFKPDVIERQLAHAERNKVRAAYNRAEYLPDRRKMMQWWSDYLQAAENISKSNAKQAA